MLSSAGDQLILANIHKLVPMAHASYYARRRETNPLKTQMNQCRPLTTPQKVTYDPPKDHLQPPKKLHSRNTTWNVGADCTLNDFLLITR